EEDFERKKAKAEELKMPVAVLYQHSVNDMKEVSGTVDALHEITGGNDNPGSAHNQWHHKLLPARHSLEHSLQQLVHEAEFLQQNRKRLRASWKRLNSFAFFKLKRIDAYIKEQEDYNLRVKEY